MCQSMSHTYNQHDYACAAAAMDGMHSSTPDCSHWSNFLQFCQHLCGIPQLGVRHGVTALVHDSAQKRVSIRTCTSSVVSDAQLTLVQSVMPYIACVQYYWHTTKRRSKLGIEHSVSV